jgi:hypothetical protein
MTMLMTCSTSLYPLLHMSNSMNYKMISRLWKMMRGNDVWNFPWGNTFSTKKVYNLLKGEEFTPTSILDIWKTCNIPRQKFFSWLLLQGRLNTKDLMSRKNFFVEFNDCILCNDCPQETIMHMFFECNFSQGFWWAIGIE